MKIAVAGHPETTSIPHFGHAELFTIFELDEGQTRMLEVRSNRSHCGDAGGERPELEQTVTMLADCVAVLAGKIGPCARDALTERAIIPLEFESASLDEVPALLQRLKLRLHAQARRRGV